MGPTSNFPRRPSIGSSSGRSPARPGHVLDVLDGKRRQGYRTGVSLIALVRARAGENQGSPEA